MNGPRFSFDELVVDTSVVVKFFVGEPDSDKAQALLQSFRVGAVDLVAVDFLFAEFVNTLWLKTYRSRMAVGEAEE